MKTKQYITVLMALAMAIPSMTGCDNDLEDYSKSAAAAKPSDKFNTTIHYISRLSDAPLATNDTEFKSVNDHLVTTLKGTAGSWLTVLDRADAGVNDGKLAKTMQIALNTKQWTANAFNRIANKTSYEGSMLLFNAYTTQVKGTPVGSTYITGLAPTMIGSRTDKDETGKVINTVPVSFTVNFRTVRFETSDQINAFGGENGVMNTLKRENMNILMIGTVKNDLFGALQSAVQNADAAFIVSKVTEGPAYSIFMLAEERFWGFTDVKATSLGNGIEAYGINVMW